MPRPIAMPMFLPYDPAQPMPGRGSESEGYDNLHDFLMGYIGARPALEKSAIPDSKTTDAVRAALMRNNPDLGSMCQQAGHQIEAFCHQLQLTSLMLNGLEESEHMHIRFPLALNPTHSGMPLPPEDCHRELAEMRDFYAGLCAAPVPDYLVETAPITRFKDYVRGEILPRIEQHMALYQQFAEDVEAHATNLPPQAWLAEYMGTIGAVPTHNKS